MIVMDGVLTILVAQLALSVIKGIFNFFRNLFGEVKNVRAPDISYIPGASDLNLIAESREIIQRHFPNSIEQTMTNMSAQKRIDTIIKITDELADCYAVDITSPCIFQTTDEFVKCGLPPTTCGYYCDANGIIAYNLDVIVNGTPEMLRDAIDTIVHECRHAFQHKAIKEDFQGVAPETLEAWRRNIGGEYISAGLDLEGYVKQPVEYDARNFAALVMRNL